MSDLFSTSINGTIRSTPNSVPFLSLGSWPTSDLTPDKWSYRKFHVESPVAISLEGYSLVRSMAFISLSATAVSLVSYRDNLGVNINLLVLPRSTEMVGVISPSVPLVFATFSSEPTDILLLLSGA